MAISEQAAFLLRHFQPDMVRLAVNLHPSCTFWSAVEEEINRADPAGDLFSFLSIFFAPNVVQDVKCYLSFLSRSSLGLPYTLRKGNAHVAQAILADLHELPSLQDFNGWVSSTSGEIFWGASRTALPRAGREQSNAATTTAGTGGGGREIVGEGTGDGDGNGEDESSRQEHFSTMDQNIVAFLTPTKGETERNETLRARSFAFISHGGLLGDLCNLSRIYDPFNSQKGRVLLYHGTRASSLASFKRNGISPPLSRNEFSTTHTFYVSNSIRQAFEHPMHKHVSGQKVDPVSIFVFEVDVAVLHGEKMPSGENLKFKCRWYPADTPARLRVWSDFCAANLNNDPNTIAPHTCDVVIGPVCYYRNHEGDYGKLYVEMPNSISLTQVALCTPRARAWLQRCFKRVYLERRSIGTELQPSASPSPR